MHKYIILLGHKQDFSVPPPVVPPNYMHQPPPPINLEYGQTSEQSYLGQLKGAVENPSCYDKDSKNSNLYSPTKPTCTPTKVQLSSQGTSEVEDKGKLNTRRNCAKGN